MEMQHLILIVFDYVLSSCPHIKNIHPEMWIESLATLSIPLVMHLLFIFTPNDACLVVNDIIILLNMFSV